MWIRKIDREIVSGATINSATVPIQLYVTDPKKMTLKQFIDGAEEEVKLVKKHIDKEGVCAEYKLTKSQCTAWKALVEQVRGLDLIAYGLTELMPSSEGDLNVAVLDILLKNAGSTYVFTIPALHDMMLSLGFYQHTSYAVNGSGGYGASRINKYLTPPTKIPGSVIMLRDGQHHRAAYLFSLDNFANLAKRTNDKEFAVLKRALKQKPGDIVTFMAVAHHNPKLAMGSAKSWLGSGARGDINPHLKGRLRPYGKKSDNNLRALENLVK